LQQLLRGTFNTPSANVSVLYDTIFYDGDGTTTYFVTSTGGMPAGGNVVVYIGDQIQIDTAIDANVGTYAMVDNPANHAPGTYVEFVNPPVVGWRNVRLASPRLDAKIGSQLSHLAGSPVIAAGTSETIPGGYKWIAANKGLQYSSSSLARFLLDHSGTRS
jgi:hypothetical protein